MMNATVDLQQQLFGYIKRSQPHISLADELCDLLEISYDSAYRRIRGEKPLSLFELKQVCEKYKLSLDQVLQLNSDTVVFRCSDINHEVKDLESYLHGLLQEVKYFNTFRQKEMYLLAKDFAVFQFFLVPEIAAFKCFFWMRHILRDPHLNGQKFSARSFPFPNILELTKQLTKEYAQIDSVELWSEETVISTLKQIRYYKDAGLFETHEDIESTFNAFNQLLDHVEHMAEKGAKFLKGESDLLQKGSFQLYINEIILGNNTYILNLDNSLHSYINYAVLKYIETHDPRFCDSVFSSFQNLTNRSSLISKVGEKERSRFFNRLRDEAKRLQG
jgi:hypothetical protein